MPPGCCAATRAAPSVRGREPCAAFCATLRGLLRNAARSSAQRCAGGRAPSWFAPFSSGAAAVSRRQSRHEMPRLQTAGLRLACVLLRAAAMRGNVQRLDSVSVVGLSFRVPGAQDLDTLHRVLGAENTLVGPMPKSRYAADPADYERLFTTERPGTFLGVWLDDVERFDAKHFGISRVEASRMDPQQRLSLEEAWRALENAGFPPPSLAGSRTGVFIGASNHDYVLSQARDLHSADVFKVTGNALGMISNRVSHALDLRGPSFTVDTACSSALVALHQARRSLLACEVDLALVGGVNLITSPHLSVAFSRARMLAGDGRCKAFSDDADGYVRGEAVVFLVLMRTADAVRDGRRSHLDILASATNQSGHTAVVTAPRAEAQASVMADALDQAGITAADLSYLEAHGTGTPVGDPVEYEAMARVLKSTSRERPCVVGTAKVRLGHAEPASGLVGVLKVIASLRHEQIHPHRNLRRFNPALALAPQHLELPLEPSAWPRGPPRIAGVSSFGFGGTNAHLVVRSAEPPSGFVEPSMTRFAGQRAWKKPAGDRHQPPEPAPRDRSENVLEAITRHLASFVSVLPEQVDPDRPLLEFGVDSLELFTLLQRVQSQYGVTVPVERVLEPRFSLRAFAEFISASEPQVGQAAGTPSGAFSMFAPSPPDGREAEPASALERDTIELVSRRARGSKAVAQQSRAVLADNRNSAGFRLRTKALTFPLVAREARGATLLDVDGRELVDFTMGFGVHLFGHAPPFITKAVFDELRRGAPLGPQSPMAGDVARRLARLTGLERFAFANTGTEAVMLACRLARAATRRERVVVFEGAYHGTFDGLLGRPSGGPLTPGTTESMVADLVVLPWNDPAALEWLKREGTSVAAVMVEPVQSRNPAVQPVEFLAALRGLTTEAGAALVFDEVITGFRCAPGGAQQRFGIRADLAVYGKVLGGGFPIGAVGGSARFLDGIDGGAWHDGDSSAPRRDLVFFAGTFCKHPVAMAAAQAVLERLESDGVSLLATLEERTRALASVLTQRLGDERLPLKVSCFASLFRFQSPHNLDLFFARLNAAGFYVWEGRTLFLSEAHGDDHLARFADAVVEIARCTLGGEPAPVTGPQRRFLELPVGSRAGNVAFALELRGALAPSRLETVVRELIERHEAFRATFDRARATVAFGGASRATVETVQLGSVEAVAARLEQFAQATFDVERGPLARFTIFDCGDARCCLALIAHGAVLDATSMAVLLSELALRISGSSALTSAPSYRDAMTALLRIPEEALAFWLERFPAGLPEHRWPSVFAQARRLKHLIDSERVRELRTRARAAGVTLFTWLLTAFGRAVGAEVPGPVVVVVPVADRRFSGGERIVGNLTQLVAVPLPDAAGTRWEAALASNAVMLPRCYEYARLAIGELCAALAARGLPHSMPEVLFNVEPALRIPALTMPDGRGLTFAEVDVPRPEARYALSVNVLEREDGLRVDVDWRTDAVPETSIRRVLDRFVDEALQCR